MLLEFVKDNVDGLAVGAVFTLVNCGVGVRGSAVLVSYFLSLVVDPALVV